MKMKEYNFQNYNRPENSEGSRKAEETYCHLDSS